jgi:hypothetical protein
LLTTTRLSPSPLVPSSSQKSLLVIVVYTLSFYPTNQWQESFFWEETSTEKIPSSIFLWTKDFQELSRLVSLVLYIIPFIFVLGFLSVFLFFGIFLGDFAYLSLTLNFLVTPEFLNNDWLRSWIG